MFIDNDTIRIAAIGDPPEVLVRGVEGEGLVRAELLKASPALGFWTRRAALKIGSRRNCLSRGGIYSARLTWSSSTLRPSISKARAARRLDGTARAKIIGRISSSWWWGWRWICTVGVSGGTKMGYLWRFEIPFSLACVFFPIFA